MPKISIIVPVYKVEKYLCRCIDSILNQSFEDFELILVDDGSPDSCGIICDEYCKKDKRIKVIHKENGGLSSARNAGLDIAQGEYIGFVDSDDYINKDMYNIMYREIKKTNSDIVICNYKNVYNYDYFNIKAKYKIEDIKYFNKINALEELYGIKKIQFIVAWNKLYKKSIFLNLRYEENKIHEDEFIIHKILYKCKNVKYINCELYYYMQRKNSIMSEDFNIKKLDAVYALNDRAKFFRINCLQNLTEKAQYEYINAHFTYYFKCKSKLNNVDAELKKLRIIFIKNIIFLLKSPLFNWKEKIKWIIFCINPQLYQSYYEYRGFELY